MTGFGFGDAPLGDGRVTVELRALNHRFLDVRVRLPEELLDQSFFMEQLARESLARGRFDVDQYKILVKYLAGKARMKIVELPAFRRRDTLDTLCTAS